MCVCVALKYMSAKVGGAIYALEADMQLHFGIHTAEVLRMLN